MDGKLIGKNLKYIRKTNGFTRNDFSYIINMSLSALQSQEQGRPTLDLVIRYSKYFNVKVDDICFKDLQNENKK